jgi:hypothetical protein
MHEPCVGRRIWLHRRVPGLASGDLRGVPARVASALAVRSTWPVLSESSSGAPARTRSRLSFRPPEWCRGSVPLARPADAAGLRSCSRTASDPMGSRQSACRSHAWPRGAVPLGRASSQRLVSPPRAGPVGVVATRYAPDCRAAPDARAFESRGIVRPTNRTVDRGSLMTARRVVDVIGAGVSREIPVRLAGALIGARSRRGGRAGPTLMDPRILARRRTGEDLPVAVAVEYRSASRCGWRVEVVDG